MFTIGEFSKLTGLTVKTLRFYHQEQLLIPVHVDRDSGYRYYEENQIETARVITFLRSLEFPVNDIRELLQPPADEDVLTILERHHQTLRQRLGRLQSAVRSLEQFLSEERLGQAMTNIPNDVQEKTLEPLLIGGIRMTGRYSDCGPAFARLGRSFGRLISGKPLLLHYNDEYHEDDADFEACLPVRRSKEVQGVSVRELPGGKCVSVVHQGPYDQLGRAYAKILNYAHARNYQVLLPTREVYWKGPGLIFRGNPKNYITEIQMLVKEADSAL